MIASPETPATAASPAEAASWFAKWFGEDYLAVYPHRDASEAARVLELLREKLRGRDIHRVLDLACGAGRHSRALGAVWWTVGFDLSETLLRVARREAPTISFVRGDIRVLPFRPGSFSLVVNLFTSFGYFSDDRDHGLVISEVAAVTARAGVFALDYLNAEKVVRDLTPYDERAVKGEVVEQRRSITEGGKFVEKRITLREKRKSFVERVRLFSRFDLETMLEAGGFEIDEVMGDYSGAAWTPNSDRTILMAVRR